MSELTEKHPELPHVMFAGLGRGFAATASACPANRADAETTEASMKLRIIVVCMCVREVKFVRRVGVIRFVWLYVAYVFALNNVTR